MISSIILSTSRYVIFRCLEVSHCAGHRGHRRRMGAARVDASQGGMAGCLSMEKKSSGFFNGPMFVWTGTRWWFQIFFYFHLYLGKIPILTNIFQMGWNHQLGKVKWAMKKTPWLFRRFVGDDVPTHLYGDYIINHYKDHCITHLGGIKLDRNLWYFFAGILTMISLIMES